MQAMGLNGQLLVDFEDKPGEMNENPKAVRVEFIKSGVKADQNQNVSNVIKGRRDPAEPYRGFIDVAGDIEIALDLRQIGIFLRAAFGLPVTKKLANGYFQHVFKLSNAMPSITIEQGFKDIGIYAAYTGCKIGKMSFSFGGDGELAVTISIMGMRETLRSESFASEAAFLVADKLNFDNAFLNENHRAVAIATEVSVEIDFSPDGETYCLGGGGFRSAVNDGIAKISGKMKALLKDRDLLDKATSGANSSLEIPLIKGERSLNILMPEVKYKRSTPGIEGPKGVQIESQYDAFYTDSSENTAIQFTLINDIESYKEMKMPPKIATVGDAVVGEAIVG